MKHGIVAAGHSETAEAAAIILREGGNAFDAAVAAMLAACVSESASISVGGGGFLLASPTDGKNQLYDFFTQTPKQRNLQKGQSVDFHKVTIQFSDTTQDFHIGLGSAAVPGILAGAAHIHQQLGSRFKGKHKFQLRELLQPAIQLARMGVMVNDFQAEIIRLLTKIIGTNPIGKKAFFHPNEKPKQEGDLVKIDQLDSTLEAIAYEGIREFYEGEIAKRLVRDCHDKGGFITLQDLKNYQVIERLPFSFQYRDRTILTNPPPSSGGSLIAFCLELLKPFNLRKKGWGTTQHLQLLAQTIALTNEARKTQFDAHIYHPKLLQSFFASENLMKHQNILRKQADKIGSTTQISVVDRAGNMASITISAGTGSGYYIPQTGIMMNNMLGEADLNPNGFHRWPLDRRISSMMAPTIVLDEQQRPQIGLGSAGSSRIRTAILQVISNMLDFDMPLKTAVRSARLHVEGNSADFEKGFDVEQLHKIALPVPYQKNIWENRSIFFGGVHAVYADYAHKHFAAAGDDRRSGTVVCV